MTKVKKYFSKILIVFLAVLLCFGGSVDVFAKATQITYISDIKIGYGTSGKQALQSAGYTVWEDLDANDGGRGDSVWLGYLTTEDATEAITDISLMNMEGGYSFGAWADEVKQIKAAAETLLNKLVLTIDEFKTNFDAENEYARQAYEIINVFEETDSNQLVADFLLSEKTTNEQLKNMLLYANADFLDVIETALALACTTTDGSNLLDRLETYHYTGKAAYYNNTKREICNVALTDLQTVLKTAESIEKDYEQKVENSNGLYAEISDYVATLSEEMQHSYVQYAQTLASCKNTAYADTGNTLYDVAMSDLNKITDDMLEPLANCLTDGQLGIVESASLTKLILYAESSRSEDNLDNIAELIGCLSDLEEYTTISVYSGVDRSLFEDEYSVAMTTDALREKAAREGNTFGVDKEWNFPEWSKITFATVTAVAFATAATTFAVYYFGESALGAATVNTMSGSLLSSYGDGWFVIGKGYDVFKPAWSATQAKIMTTVIIVAIIVAVVFAVLTLVSFLVHPNLPDKISYTQIPRIIVDKDSAGGYTYYYAAENIASSASETDTLKRFGDLNAVNEYNQWFVLYYTKDADAGLPITTEMLVKGSEDSSLTGYTSLHEFGSSAAVDLNKYNSGENCKTIYVYLKTYDAEANIASVFSKPNLIRSSVASFVLGAAAAAIIAVASVKKKRKEA